MRKFPICIWLLGSLPLIAGDRAVSIHFRGQVGGETFRCGKKYNGVGVTGSTISGRDFRFFVSNLRLLDNAGKETPVVLDQDGKWQLDDLALLDFEDGTSTCANGTPELHDTVTGKVAEGKYTALRFVLGLPFNRNHGDPLTQPSPLNLTALMWVWNAGHKFARLDISSTGIPRGFTIHLGSTGCTPDDTDLTIPTTCSAPNRVDVALSPFDSDRDLVIADLAALLQSTNVDATQNRAPPGAPAGAARMAAGCMSGPTTPDCAGLFANFGLPFGDRRASEQKFFRAGKAGPIEVGGR